MLQRLTIETCTNSTIDRILTASGVPEGCTDIRFRMLRSTSVLRIGEPAQGSKAPFATGQRELLAKRDNPVSSRRGYGPCLVRQVYSHQQTPARTRSTPAMHMPIGERSKTRAFAATYK